jgi:hypothetical protein
MRMQVFMPTPKPNEILLALGDDDSFKTCFKNISRILRAAKKYPDLRESIYKKLLSTSDLLKFYIKDNNKLNYLSRAGDNLMALVVARLIEYNDVPHFKKLFEVLNQVIAITSNFPDTKEMLSKHFLLTDELRKHFISSRRLIEKFVQEFPERTEDVEELLRNEDVLYTYLYSVADVEYFIKSFPNLQNHFPRILLNHRAHDCLIHYNPHDFAQLMTHVFPAYSDRFFELLMAKEYETLFMRIFYHHYGNPLDEFFEGVKSFPEQYHGRLWDKMAYYGCPRMLEGGMERGNTTHIESLTLLITRAIESKFLSRETAKYCQQLVLTTASQISDNGNSDLKQKLSSLNDVLEKFLFPVPDVKEITKLVLLTTSTSSDTRSSHNKTPPPNPILVV